MAFGLLLPLRIVQGIFAVIVLGLSGYVAHWYNTDTLTASPSQINFLIFIPIFSFISIAYLELTPRFLSKGKATHQERYQHQQRAQESKLTIIASHPYAHFALEAINVLFYFAGFVALSTFLSKLLFCRGSVCAAARADAVFAAFSFLLWAGSSALIGRELFKGFMTDRKSRVAMKEAKGAAPNSSPA